jgi:hypothetical protein
MTIDPDLAAQERHESLSRRRFLKGVGVCAALPAFESLLLPSLARAAGPALAVSPSGAPLRMAFVYVPNGTIPGYWWPKVEENGDGKKRDLKDFELNRTMEPLAPVKHQIQILGNMDHVNSTPGPDGPGDHARASGTFLTGVRVKKTAGADIHAGPSIDQLVARQVGHVTRFPSLELSCDAVRRSGNCDSGYSCAYQYNLAWRTATMPLAPEPNPRLVFERLFGAGKPGERRANLQERQNRQRSVLDFVRDDAASLQRQLAPRDQRKLDEYLTGVREIEQRIQHAEQFKDNPEPEAETPAGIPTRFEEYLALMFDMLLLAFQTDSTRIATFLLANEGSNRAFPEIGIAEGHHFLTHHRGKKEMVDKVAEIDRFYLRQFGRFLEKMEAAKDADGKSILHNSMIVYGSGNADGNRHTHRNLPVLLAGSGGGSLNAGRFVKFESTPMSNMLLSLGDRLGATSVERLGDSTGRLEGI